MRLIELDAALEGLENLNAISFYEANEHSKEAYTETKDMLKALPTVDAVPVKHGRWLWRNYPGYQYQCDQCKRWAMYESKFCPECGALMKWWKDGEHHD